MTFFLAALGQAYQDTYANTFVASVKSAHRWLGFIHAMYMAGCLVAPFVSTAVASSGTDSGSGSGAAFGPGTGVADGFGSAGPSSRWSLFYIAPLGLGTLNLGLVLFAFWDLLGFKPRAIHPGDGQTQDGDGEAVSPTGTGSGAGKEMWMTLSMPSVWAVSLYFFFFLGAVITAGGESVSFLVVMSCHDCLVRCLLMADWFRLDRRVSGACARWRSEADGLRTGWILRGFVPREIAAG